MWILYRQKTQKYSLEERKCKQDSICKTLWNLLMYFNISYLMWKDFSTAVNLVTSRAFWTLAWTEPSRSAPIFFSSCVRRTKSQSCRSSLCRVMKSTRVSKNMLKTWDREKGMKKRRGKGSRQGNGKGKKEGRENKTEATVRLIVHCVRVPVSDFSVAHKWQEGWLLKMSSWFDQKVSKHLLSGVCLLESTAARRHATKKHILLVFPAVSSDTWAV